jgi:hypothetical protein
LWERGRASEKNIKVPVGSRFSTSHHQNHWEFIMEKANTSAQALREQILTTEAQLHKLKKELAQVEASTGARGFNNSSLSESPVTQQNGKRWPLSEEEYKRYGRQMIVPSIGIQGISSLSLPPLLNTDL